jgi:hypothetical protein
MTCLVDLPGIRSNNDEKTISAIVNLSFLYQLMKQAGFPFEKTLGVKRFFQAQKFIIEVMAELVKDGAKECLKGHHLFSLGCSHPNCDLI